MQETLGAVRRRSALLVQAPTGTGKTISALFPAVKSLPRNYCDRIFYLTAKTSTRFSAEKALDDMRAKGMVLKSLTLTAKEKICLCPEMYCDPNRCRFAVGYYDRLRSALGDLYQADAIRREEVVRTAEVFQVCPFELSLDISLQCDVIIADYNYVFDPRIRLERFFGEEAAGGYALLVDEAHNLPERSRGMYSAEITSGGLAAARRAAVGQDPMIARALGSIARYMLTCSDDLKAEGPGISAVEPTFTEKDVVAMGPFRASRRKPEALVNLLRRFVAVCRDPIDALPAGRNRRNLQDFFFECMFFLRVQEEFFDATYVTTADSSPTGLALRLMCLDASRRVRDTYLDKHSAIFFSATMSPPDYFAGLLCGPRTEDRPEKLLLSSPFPEENLLLLCVETLSTKYAARSSSLPAVASHILAATSQRTGNYLVYLPSFDYLRSVAYAYQSLLHGEAESKGIDIVVQSQGMDEAKREAFLERFSHFGKRTLVAFAVLGGVFGEGIDLVGERLTGVVIVGVGLPQLCGEREVMKDYFANAFGSGFEFAYMYPGFNKVQQAAGRLIRSDSDRGFILLLDERYGKPEYRSLFPDEWHPVEATTSKEVAERISEFFGDD
jgi:DNA excision repair protein ERCC-2